MNVLACVSLCVWLSSGHIGEQPGASLRGKSTRLKITESFPRAQLRESWNMLPLKQAWLQNQGKSYDSRLRSFSVTSFWDWKSDPSSLTAVILVRHLRPRDCHGADWSPPSPLLHLGVRSTAGTGFLVRSQSGGPLWLKGSVAMEQLEQNKTIIVPNLLSR